MIIKKLVMLILAVGCSSVAHSAVITQTFDSTWSVDVWDYYGDVSAMEWQYQEYTPWDSSLGKLTSVEISTQISGVRENASDAVRIRNAFFTGWNPVKYQYSKTAFLEGGENKFTADWTRSYTTPYDIAAVTNYLYFTGEYGSGAGTGGAWYYFESRTESAGHSIEATTTISYFYEINSVSEPHGLVLFCAVLAAMNWSQRKKKNAKYSNLAGLHISRRK